MSYVPDLDDRRRLAEAAVLLELERNGVVTPIRGGEIVKQFVTNSGEIVPLADQLNASLARRFCM